MFRAIYFDYVNFVVNIFAFSEVSGYLIKKKKKQQQTCVVLFDRFLCFVCQIFAWGVKLPLMQ